jgi:3',5'-cyclic-AMP phosphodiesterase
VIVAHLSDPHLTVGALGGEPAAGLHRALGRALAIRPLPDCVVLTGDLADHGDAAEYELLREIVGRFPVPIHLVTGNHDDSAALVAAFGGTAFIGAHAHYSVEYPEATIVVLDSADPGSAAGYLGADQLEWLDTTLAGRPDVPAFVCLHHPPVPVGLPYMDAIRLRDGEDLVAVIARHPHVVRILAGHLHRVVTTMVANTVLTVAPSTYRQLALTMDENAVAFALEPTAFLLHQLTGASCVTHTVAVSHASAQFGVF